MSCLSIFIAANFLLTRYIVFVDLACSGKFWKKMDHIFAAVNVDDMQNMKDQVIIDS